MSHKDLDVLHDKKDDVMYIFSGSTYKKLDSSARGRGKSNLPNPESTFLVGNLKVTGKYIRDMFELIREVEKMSMEELQEVAKKPVVSSTSAKKAEDAAEELLKVLMNGGKSTNC